MSGHGKQRQICSAWQSMAQGQPRDETTRERCDVDAREDRLREAFVDWVYHSGRLPWVRQLYGDYGASPMVLMDWLRDEHPDYHAELMAQWQREKP